MLIAEALLTKVLPFMFWSVYMYTMPQNIYQHLMECVYELLTYVNIEILKCLFM